MLRSAKSRLIARSVSISQLLLAGGTPKAPGCTFLAFSSSSYSSSSSSSSSSPSSSSPSTNRRPIHSSGKKPEPEKHQNSNSRPGDSKQRQWNNSPPQPLPGRGTGLYNLPYKNQFAPPQVGPSIKAPPQGAGLAKPTFAQRAHVLTPYTPGYTLPGSQEKNGKLQALLADITGIDPAPAPPKKKNLSSARAQPGQGAPPPVQSRPPPLQGQQQFGAPPPVQSQFGGHPPPQGQQRFSGPPPVQSQLGGPLGQQHYGAPPPVQSRPPPPQGQQQFGAQPPVQSQFGGPPPQQGQQHYSAPPPVQSQFGRPPPPQGQQQFGAPPPEQSQLGRPPHPQGQQHYGAPPPVQSQLGRPPPQQGQQHYSAPPPVQSQFGRPPPPQGQQQFGAPPPEQSQLGRPPLPQGQQQFRAPSPVYSQFGGPPPLQGQQQFGAPLPVQSQFGRPPPPQGQQHFGVSPPVQSQLGGPPPPQGQQRFSAPPPVQSQLRGPLPPQQHYGAPPPVQSRPPPLQGQQQFGAPPPVQSQFGRPPPPQGQQQFGAPPPVQSQFGRPPPPQGQQRFSAPTPAQSQLGGPPPPQGQQRFSAPTPVQSQLGGPPPPQGQQRFNAPTPVQSQLGGPPPPQGQQQFGGPPPPQGQQHFSAPPPVQSQLGGPPPPQGQQQFGGPQQQSSPLRAQQTYPYTARPEQSQQSQLGGSSPRYGAPQTQYGAQQEPHFNAPPPPLYDSRLPQGQTQIPSEVVSQYSAIPSHPFAVQPQQGQSSAPPPVNAQQYGARPATAPHQFAVQQHPQGQTPAAGQYSSRPTPSPPFTPQQTPQGPLSSPSHFTAQQPAQTDAPKSHLPWHRPAETPQGQSSAPPSVAAQYGARPASLPSPFAVQQPVQAEEPKSRFPWMQPAAETLQGTPTITQYNPTPNYRSSQQGSQYVYGTGQQQGQWQQGEGQQGYNPPRYGQNYGDREQPRYQRRDGDSGYQRRDEHPFQRHDDSRYPSRQQQQQQEPDRTQFLREKQRADTTPVDPEPFDTRKKKAALIKDKDKRSAAFTNTESFLLDDDPAALAQREAKLAKKKAKREQPIPILIQQQFISVSLLANQLKVPLDRFLEKLGELGFVEIGYNHVLSAEDAGLIAMEYNYEPIVDTSIEKDLLPRPWPPSTEEKELLPPRPPVVTIMGHVDHGKTTLLDYLRKSSVAASEHGGITQHIGAFSVNLPSGKLATFLDTPGHAAFLSMRERGANVTDIVILVVAADDSVMPQTVEAIKHAKAAGVPMIVAVNKCDKESANIEKVKADLAQHDVQIEDVGGETQVIPVSGKTGLGMDDLEEATMALAEVLDMRAEVDGPAEGWILEATTKKRGRVATVLVRRGTLRQGDIIVAGSTWARIRNLLNEAGAEVTQAGPGTPVEVDGWRDQPTAGDLVIQAPSEEKAKSVVEFRLAKAERLRQATDMDAINSSRKLLRDQNEAEKLASAEIAAVAEADSAKKEEETGPEVSKLLEIPFLVKADVSGSVEAVTNALTSLGNNEIRAKLIRSGVGPVSEFDIDLASATNATILTFNLSLPPPLLAYSRSKHPPVAIHPHTIIYHLAACAKSILETHLPLSINTKVTGEAEILKIFPYKVKNKGQVPFAGCRVKLGTLDKASKIRVRRGAEVIWEGNIASMKSGKDDAELVRAGSECGLGLDGWDGFKVGDVLQCFYEVVVKRELPMGF